ncbi:hypothetical protein BU52_03500 [Streptomyces toyocaensis]|uniref:ANTAR domain-containing protein n=1 Tax=Streptomyces toyocaensis TaxID=55952 RepID=A0A081Y005_STRTO|nr:ANTAR domain-containing protein [Streptomyces toyocaensis]KES09128.1 hypothetical protein BU52_03500 [Streptomyces toyocaensis]
MSSHVAPGPVDFRAAFLASPAPLLILDTHLVIRDVNPAYAVATRRERDELLGRLMFDAFPDNPHDPEADGVANLGASLERALRDRVTDTMPVQRYDIPWKQSATGFQERYWTPVNSPVLDRDGEVTGLVHHVEDVTDVHERLRRVHEAHERTDTPAAHQAQAQHRFARYLARAEQDRMRLEHLEAETEQLRHALTSRAVIDQAIGIVGAERRCAPDDAFQILVGISQRTNVKLRDVAAALVGRAAAERTGPLLPDAW